LIIFDSLTSVRKAQKSVVSKIHFLTRHEKSSLQTWRSSCRIDSGDAGLLSPTGD
jgi:hypothetical protein